MKLEIVKEADVQLGGGISGGGGMCAVTSDISSLIGFEPASFVAQLCGEARWFW